MLTTIGIDLAKTVLHAVAMDAGGKVVQRRRLDRGKLVEWLANQEPCLVGMEACAGAHHLARALAAQGHDVRLMPGQYVKPFVKTHKNDLADAEAIAEAVQRPQMRFVPVKTPAQLDVQALHAVLGARLPEGHVLSHDLLEGAIARCAGVSDVTLVEDAPGHPDVAASRIHRWTRGDWRTTPAASCATCGCRFPPTWTS